MPQNGMLVADNQACGRLADAPQKNNLSCNMMSFDPAPPSKFTVIKNVFQALRRSRWFLGVLLFAGITLRAGAQADMIVYDDAVENGWVNSYGWASILLNYANTSPVHSGSDSIAVGCNGYEAVYIHHNGTINTSPYLSLSFWLNGGTGGQSLVVQVVTNGVSLPANSIITAPANTWQVTMPCPEGVTVCV